MHEVVDGRVIRVLVVDDEPPGRRRLVRLLDEQPGVVLVGTAENGLEAIDAIRQLEPDLVFLDIQMPFRNGLEVVQEIGSAAMPVTIFVTAHDEHALRAFDLAAVDYLVKPYDDERFEQAFGRARRIIEMEGRNRMLDQLFELMRGGVVRAAPAETPRGTCLERISVQMRGKVTVIPVSSIDYIVASGSYAEIHLGGQRHLLRQPIQTLEEQLDPARFLRIHRSVIVRIDLVESLIRNTSGDYEVQLRGGTRLRVGRSRREMVQRRLGRF